MTKIINRVNKSTVVVRLGDFLVVLFLLWTCSGVSRVSSSVQTYQEVGLKLHNAYREKHGTPPLKLDANLNLIALACAKYYASGNKAHTCPQSRKYGENIAGSKSSKAAPRIDVTAKDGIKRWYLEIKSYNWKAPGKSRGVVGHFTQLVWKSSKKLGFACARGDQKWTKCVGIYSPPGNFQGAQRKNVLKIAEKKDKAKDKGKPKAAEKATKKPDPKTAKTAKKEEEKSKRIAKKGETKAAKPDPKKGDEKTKGGDPKGKSKEKPPPKEKAAAAKPKDKPAKETKGAAKPKSNAKGRSAFGLIYPPTDIDQITDFENQIEEENFDGGGEVHFEDEDMDFAQIQLEQQEEESRGTSSFRGRSAIGTDVEKTPNLNSNFDATESQTKKSKSSKGRSAVAAEKGAGNGGNGTADAKGPEKDGDGGDDEEGGGNSAEVVLSDSIEQDIQIDMDEEVQVSGEDPNITPQQRGFDFDDAEEDSEEGPLPEASDDERK